MSLESGEQQRLRLSSNAVEPPCHCLPPWPDPSKIGRLHDPASSSYILYFVYIIIM